MKILVTGGAGFIGTNLSLRLLRLGHEIYCLDNLYSCLKQNVKILEKQSNFIFRRSDIIDDLPKLFESVNFDQIYHLACPASPPCYQKDPIYTLRVGYEGTRNILDFMLRKKNQNKKIPRMLFASTSEVYGDPIVHPQKEEYCGNVNPIGLRSCYDEGKRVAESLCVNYLKTHNLPVKIVRIFNTYGPHMDPYDGRVVSNFIVQALKGQDLTIYGEGRQTRSFQYIDDLLAGMIDYMNLEEPHFGPLNLGNPHEFTIMELAELVKNKINPRLNFIFEKLPSDDPLQRCPDIGLAKKLIGFEPKTNLAEGLNKTVDYFKKLLHNN